MGSSLKCVTSPVPSVAMDCTRELCTLQKNSRESEKGNPIDSKKKSTVGIRCIQPPDFVPLISIVNESCNIECCVNNMLQIIRNMMVSQGLELKPSMFRRTTISGQHLLIYSRVQNFQKYSTPSSH